MDYVSVEQARELPGLRLVLSAGVPGPWSESAKALVNHKGLDWTAVYQKGGGSNEDLMAWTGQTSAPVAVYDELPPACHWLDLLMLLERIAPEPVLVPADPALRAQVIGLAALIAGAEGYGWQRRLGMLTPMLQIDNPPVQALRLAAKYGYSAEAAAASTDHMLAICRQLDKVLADTGSGYFVGDAATAVDFYWACFLGMTMPLPPEVNPMPDYMRPVYECRDESVLACITPRLIAHRDMMYQRHIALPLNF